MYDRQRPQPSAPTRALALGALLLAIVVVAYILLSSGSSYTVRLLFSDASGLVTGDQVMIGPSSVGSVQSVEPHAERAGCGRGGPQWRRRAALPGHGRAHRGERTRRHREPLRHAATRRQRQRADSLRRHDLRRATPTPRWRSTRSSTRSTPRPGKACATSSAVRRRASAGRRCRPTGRSSTWTRCCRARARSRVHWPRTSPPSTSCSCRAHRRCSGWPRAASS